MDSKPTHGPAIAALRDRQAELDGGILRVVSRRRTVGTKIGRLKAAAGQGTHDRALKGQECPRLTFATVLWLAQYSVPDLEIQFVFHMPPSGGARRCRGDRAGPGGRSTDSSMNHAAKVSGVMTWR